MHRASILDRGDQALRPPPRRFNVLVGYVLPWHWARMFEGFARREAKRLDCAFVHFGVNCVLHLPEASYTVPWRDVRAHRDGPLWNIHAAGMVLVLSDDFLAAWERRRLEYSTHVDSA